jgi:hypothetical protein
VGADTVTFGVGCYSFEAVGIDFQTLGNESGTYTFSDWLRDVQTALEALPSADNIVIEGITAERPPARPSWRNQTDRDLKSMDDRDNHGGGDFVPHPVNGRIAFSLTIPVRTQQRVFPWREPIAGGHFDIDVRYGYGMPVAFVSTGSPVDSPSSAVAIVREFLYSEFKQRASEVGPIRFTCMGPSPMWNDFGLSPSPRESGSLLGVEVTDRPGYRQLDFKFNSTMKGVFTKSFTPFDLLKATLQPELSLYYEIVSRGATISQRRRLIEIWLGELVESHRKTGLIAWASRLFRGDATTLALEVLSAKTDARSAVMAFSQERSEVEARSGLHAFGSDFDREVSDLEEVESSDLENIVGLLSDRHARDLQIVSVVASSVLGGLVGAALTGLITVLTAKP